MSETTSGAEITFIRGSVDPGCQVAVTASGDAATASSRKNLLKR
jgi:hypothetical protein